MPGPAQRLAEAVCTLFWAEALRAEYLSD